MDKASGSGFHSIWRLMLQIRSVRPWNADISGCRLFDLAAIEDHGSISQIGDLAIMGDHQNGQA